MPTKSGWTIDFFSDAVRRDVQELPDRMRASFLFVRKRIEDEGPHRIPSHYKKNLKGEDGLWELRLRGDKAISRALYVTRRQSRLIILVVFEKKSQGIPKHILKLARQRARQV